MKEEYVVNEVNKVPGLFIFKGNQLISQDQIHYFKNIILHHDV
jgi:hypothetical protein